MNQTYSIRPDVGQVSWPNEEIAEVSLLMPGWQAEQLVALANSQRVTVGQLLRCLIGKHLTRRATESKRQKSTMLSP